MFQFYLVLQQHREGYATNGARPHYYYNLLYSQDLTFKLSSVKIYKIHRHVAALTIQLPPSKVLKQ